MLGITLDERHEIMPDVPTFKEQGYDLMSGITRLFAVPAGTDPEVVERLRTGFENICKNPAYIEDMKKIGQPEEFINGNELKPMIEAENEEQKAILEDAGLLNN